MKPGRRTAAFPVWTTIALTAAIALAGVWLLRTQVRQLRDAVNLQLAAVARLKAGEVESWRAAVLDRTTAVAGSPLLSAAIAPWLTGGAPEPPAVLVEHLRSVLPRYHFSAISFLDPSSRPLIGFPTTPTSPSPETLTMLETVRRGGGAVLGELYRERSTDLPRIDAVVALRDPGSGRLMGFIVTSSDAAATLYPILASWPVPSESAEALLVRRDGDEVLYLNELRHRSGAALELGIPLAQKDVPAVRAALGERGVVSGVDYRGVSVLAAIEAVPGSPWLVIAKVDADEALAGLRTRSALLIILLGVLLTGAVAGAALLWQRNEKLRYREAYRGELERKALLEHFESLVEHANDIILLTDQEQRIVEANQRALEAYGYDRAGIVGLPAAALVAPEDMESGERRRGALAASGSYRGEAVHRRRDGSSFPVEESARTIVVEDKHFVQSIIRDITERKRIEDALRASEQQFRLVVDSAAEGIVIRQGDQIVLANPYAQRLFGATPERIASVHYLEFTHPEDRALIARRTERRAAGESVTESVQYRLLNTAGEPVWVEAHTASIMWGGALADLIFLTDLTEHRKAEEEKARVQERLQQSRRLEAVGLLAGGIAHDFNNMLAAILGYAELLQEDLPKDTAEQGHITQILRAAGRSRDLVHQLLAFARKQTLEMVSVDINATITGIEPMLRRTLRDDIRIILRLDPRAGRTEGDVGQIEQVILNLAVNAQDAMPHGGDLLIETSETLLDEDYASRHEGVSPGPYSCMSVSDTGVGMDKATIERIFEPFFTTKKESGGTGLGLPTAYGIVRQHRGSISVYSEPGRGSTFRVYLPRTQEAAAAPAVTSSARASEGSETVLLAEDQKELRSLAAEVLERRGYRVLAAENGILAQEIAAGFGGRIDLLLTDVVMAGMNGRELYEQLKRSRPELRVLFMSGYTADVIGRHGVLEPGVAFIQKPFAVAALLERVRAAIEGKPSGTSS